MYTALLYLLLSSGGSIEAQKRPPYQQGPTIICYIYPAPNGGFTEKCFQQDTGQPVTPTDPQPEPQPPFGPQLPQVAQ